jgi:hypothetical protein
MTSSSARDAAVTGDSPDGVRLLRSATSSRSPTAGGPVRVPGVSRGVRTLVARRWESPARPSAFEQEFHGDDEPRRPGGIGRLEPGG